MSLNSNTESMEELLAKANALPTADAVYASGYNTALMQLADRIVEQGHEQVTDPHVGIWYWAKSDSGTAFCYGTFSYGSINVGTSWGSLQQSSALTQDFPSDLFVSPPHWDVSYLAGDGGAWIVQNYTPVNPTTATSTGAFYFVRPNAFNMTSVNLGFFAIGRWK